jgi:nucleoside-diphosphate-sugar epimerase
MSRALVTGGTGFVGSHLVDQLLQRGWTVRCTVRPTSDRRWLEGKPAESCVADLGTGAGLDRALEGVDAVFHVAGVIMAPSLEQFRAGNATASKRMVDAAVAARVPRFVHVSSLAAAGPAPEEGGIDEEAECAPISAYGQTKLEGEREVWARRDQLRVTIVRPPVVYGPRDRGLLELYKVLAAGVRPQIGGPKHVSIVHVDDLVRGLADCATSDGAAGQVFYLSNARALTYAELTGTILAGLDRSALPVPVPDRVVRLLGALTEDVLALVGRGGMFNRDKAREMTQKYWVCNPSKAKRILGWEASVPIDEGLRSTLAWYRGEGWV